MTGVHQFHSRQSNTPYLEDLLLRHAYDRLISAITINQMKSYAHCSTSTTPSVGSGHDLQLISRVPPCSLKHIDTSCSLQQIDRSKSHAAGNTSSRDDNTLLTTVAGSNAGITYEFLLVHAGPRPQYQIRPLQYLVPAGSGSQPQSRPLQSLVPAGFRNPAQSAGNTAAPPPAKELEKMLTLHQGVLVFISSTHLEQRGVKEAREHMFPLLFIQKKKPNLWVPGSSFQVPDPRFRTFGCSVVRNWPVVIDKICVVT
ncbi:hypothetical protein F2Q69_00034889 [Brassica cretica]|uniref:Uncharacterized protein n=1 Tax=Brassica cretica TaxID=69181 RepID=A0A8S9SEL3_BRACR|nr:hypothetical protein F2Q69_00034889 [Brassica cretica]